LARSIRFAPTKKQHETCFQESHGPFKGTVIHFQVSPEGRERVDTVLTERSSFAQRNDRFFRFWSRDRSPYAFGFIDPPIFRIFIGRKMAF